MNYKMISLRDYVGDVLVEANHPNIVVLDSDLAKSTTSVKFQQAHPERFVECGISETSAMSIASGLAMEYKIPFVVNFSMFLTGSAWTQLRQACYANLNVKLIGTHPGMDDGPDGASHHANEDIALARVLPNLRVLTPDSLSELRSAVQLALEYNGPVFIRCSRDVVPVIAASETHCMAWGKANVVFDEGDDLAIIYEGTAAAAALEGFDMLRSKGYLCKLVAMGSIKPIDKECIIQLAKIVKGIVTVENHTILGGLGGAVAEVLSELSAHAPLMRVGVNDVFTESGGIKQVKEKYGLSGANIMQKGLILLEKGN